MIHLNIHHIGYLVKKLNAAKEEFERLGFRVIQGPVSDGFRLVDILFMEKDGYVLELVSPNDPSSVVAGLMKKYKNCPYHICYESAAFEKDLAFLTGNGYTAIDTPAPAPALAGRRVVFLMSPSVGMIELLEAAH